MIIIAIAILGAGFVFLEGKLSNSGSSAPSPTPIQKVATQHFTNADGRVEVTFPSSWYERDTTQKGTFGTFGPIIQAWTISNFLPQNTTPNGIPTNGVFIDFTIEQGGSNLSLNSLLNCSIKTTVCTTVGIDNEQFAKSITTLNTGVTTISVATLYDQNILLATATIGTESDQTATINDAEKIFNSIKFQNKPSP